MHEEKATIRKVCILSDHHPCINPRMWKDAFFFEQLGFEVVILTMWISSEFREKDMNLLRGHRIEYIPYLNLIPTELSRFRLLYYRIRKRIATELVKIGIELPNSISYAPELMYRKALKENADLYIAHLETAFSIGSKLIKKGRIVAFDFEDWYSRDYLFSGRPVKLLKSAEAFALKNGIYCTVASKSMADALRRTYDTHAELTVVYNGFSISENKVELPRSPKKSGLPKLIWFSRNIGPDRGLETLFDACTRLRTPVELHLLGMYDHKYVESLKNGFPVENGHELHIHDFIDHNQLIPFLSSFDIGLALEESVADSRQVTITNKILQYIQASLKVLATDTEGQKEVAGYFKDWFRLVRIKDPADWADGIQELIDRTVPAESPGNVFYDVFSWESQQKKYLKLLQKKKMYGIYNTESA